MIFDDFWILKNNKCLPYQFEHAMSFFEILLQLEGFPKADVMSHTSV